MKEFMAIMLLMFSALFLIGCKTLSTSTTEEITEESTTEEYTTEESSDDQLIELLYSSSYQNTNDFESPMSIIDDYDDYLESGYPLDLDSSFFDQYILYTHTFTDANTGTNMYLYDGFIIDNDNHLLIQCVLNDNLIVSPAFSEYAMIFAIDKDLYYSVERVSIEMVFDE